MEEATEIQCPVCGYYCLGNGGVGCIDKPSLVKEPRHTCDQVKRLVRRYLTPEQIAQRKRDFVNAIQPLIKIKADIYSYATPTVIVRDDGTLEYQYNFTPSQEKTLNEIDENIEYWREKIFSA